MIRIINKYKKENSMFNNFYFHFYRWVKKRYPLVDNEDIKYMWKVLKKND